MKKFISILLLLISIAVMLNINVTTRQGINYEVRTIRMPLYLKILDFVDRHYNYKQLIKKIIKNANTDEEKTMRVFEWTYQNIRRVPAGFPIIDDHVWYIIVRGYGVQDQLSDVFTTLCNYAGMDAFYNLVYKKNRASYIYLSFVKLNKRWSVLDPYYGVYFKNKNGEIAAVDEIKNGDWTMVNIGKLEKKESDYKEFLDNLPTIKEIGLKRANIQSPLRRLIYQMSKWMKQR